MNAAPLSRRRLLRVAPAAIAVGAIPVAAKAVETAATPDPKVAILDKLAGIIGRAYADNRLHVMDRTPDQLRKRGKRWAATEFQITLSDSDEADFLGFILGGTVISGHKTYEQVTAMLKRSGVDVVRPS